MKRPDICRITFHETGIFIERPNRFLAIVTIGDKREKVHVRDPGRLEELLFPGNRVLVARATKKNRKTAWDLIAAEFENRWVLVNSGKHREIATNLITGGYILDPKLIEGLQAEVKRGRSRIDFCLTLKGAQKLWIEVKGCTLAENGIALFPDAPTSRGSRHLRELIEIRKEGVRAAVIILIFRDDAERFAPYQERDPLFAETFYEAVEAGVEVYPVSLSFINGSISFNSILPF